MTTAIALPSVTAFTLTRVSKTGKETTRNLLGLIVEGTSQERLETGVALCKEAWDNGNMKVLLDTLGRVFAGRTWDMSCAFIKLDFSNPTKSATVLLLDALVRFHEDSKGIKAKYVTVCREIVEWSKDETARKEARKLAYEASLIEGAAVETK